MGVRADAARPGGARPFLLVGWLGSDDLDAAIAPVGCGCQLLDEAATGDDPVESETFAQIAPELKKRWRCPHAKYRPDPTLLDAECREVLDAVERLTGARCDTCPLAGPRHAWVAVAVEARAWAERGHLDLYAHGTPHVLVDAISLVDRGIAQRQARDTERAKRKQAASTDPPTHE